MALSVISSCAISPSGGGEEEKKDDPANENLILTEMNTSSTNFGDRAVEFSNISDEDINLDDYSLEVYRNYSNISTESISLKGYVIKAHSSFVIAYINAKEEILDKADLVTDQYLNSGSFPVALAYKGKAFDSIGVIGYNYDFAQGAVLVRRKECFKQTLEFSLYDWVRYPVNSIDTLGNYDVVDEETLLEGPKLTEEDFNKPFCTDGSIGDGGLIEVSYQYNIDGDTTKFNYGYEYSEFDVSGSLSTRYYAINTPEIAHGPGEEADPYGNEARDFTQGYLNRAKKYLVQSVNGYSFHETYGRMLGYVWIAFVTNPAPEDYVLLNYLIVKNGFSNPAFLTRNADYHSLMTYEGVSYIEYIYFAQQYAIINELNIHSGGK